MKVHFQANLCCPLLFVREAGVSQLAMPFALEGVVTTFSLEVLLSLFTPLSVSPSHLYSFIYSTFLSISLFLSSFFLASSFLPLLFPLSPSSSPLFPFSSLFPLVLFSNHFCWFQTEFSVLNSTVSQLTKLFSAVSTLPSSVYVCVCVCVCPCYVNVGGY